MDDFDWYTTNKHAGNPAPFDSEKRDAYLRIAELEAQLADANEMLEKCNSKFIVALEAEVTRLKAAMDEYSENEMLLIERCAKVCERQGKERGECPEMPEYCADAIRAMIAE